MKKCWCVDLVGSFTYQLALVTKIVVREVNLFVVEDQDNTNFFIVFDFVGNTFRQLVAWKKLVTQHFMCLLNSSVVDTDFQLKSVEKLGFILINLQICLNLFSFLIFFRLPIFAVNLAYSKNL